MEKNTKMTVCKTCGKEFAKSAKTCPGCGAKNKKPVYKRWWFLAIIVIIILIILVSIMGGGGASDNEAVQKAKEMSKTDFINSCETVEYKDLSRNSDSYIGKAITVKVNIAQIVGDGTIRAYSGGDEDPEYWYEDEFLLEDVRDNGENIIEEDIVTVNGIYLGKETIERAIGGTDDVPAIAVIYADLVE